MIWILLGMLVGAVPAAIRHAFFLRDRKRRRQERSARIAREDAAWAIWCNAAQRAIRSGVDVPPWCP